MKTYEICRGQIYIDYDDFDGYKKGMVYNSSAPACSVAECKTEAEAKDELKRRKSYVHPKGNGYEIVEYYLLEYDCLDSDTVIGFGRLIDIAKLEEKDRVLELIKASYKRGEHREV